MQKATIDNLSAVNARVATIEANYIRTSKVKAEYMEVTNWTSAGKIRADRIDADTIVAKVGEFKNQIKVTDVFVNDFFYAGRITTPYIEASEIHLGVSGSTVLRPTNYWRTIIIDGSSYTVLCQ